MKHHLKKKLEMVQNFCQEKMWTPLMLYKTYGKCIKNDSHTNYFHIKTATLNFYTTVYFLFLLLYKTKAVYTEGLRKHLTTEIANGQSNWDIYYKVEHYFQYCMRLDFVPPQLPKTWNLIVPKTTIIETLSFTFNSVHISLLQPSCSFSLPPFTLLYRSTHKTNITFSKNGKRFFLNLLCFNIFT
jgi:hypothetical protein